VKNIQICDRQAVEETDVLQFYSNPGTALAWVTLFGGDRWTYVERVAIVRNDAQQIIAIATLAPCNEEGQGGPQIIGVWVERAHRRKKLGLALLKALSQESLARYDLVPGLVPVTTAGAKLCQSVQQQNVQINMLSKVALPIDL
jgi:predicted GNAT family acetyltransferase